MKRFALPVVAILLLAGCAGQANPDDVLPTSPPIIIEPGEGESAALGLVNLWRVTGAEGEREATWLRLDANEFQLWRDCGMINGSWAATDSIFLGEAWGAMGDCATDGMPVVEWLNQVVGFTATPGGYDLLAADGSVVASLSIDGAPEPIPTAAEFFAEPPEVTDEVRAQFAAPAPLPGELEPATADALDGKWVPVDTTPTDPHVVFNAGGTWTGSDGCNGGGGRWAVDGDGGFLATSGPSTLMFCEGAPVPAWVAQASAAGMDTDGHLHLFDASGTALGSLTR
ncbi:META domain-containing protein [Homoserinimonas sp. A520]